MKSKVLVVIPDADLGGVTSSAVNFCTELVRNGYVVDVLVMNGKELPLNVNIGKTKLAGIAKYWKLSPSDLKNSPWFLMPFLIVLSIIKKITIRLNLWYPFVFAFSRVKGQYNVVMAYRQCAPCYYYATKCVKATKSIGLIHGDYFEHENYSSWDYMMRDLTHVACVSNACRDAWRIHYPEISNKFCTIYNMFDEKGILEGAAKQDVLKFNPNVVNFISVARIENTPKKIDRIPQVCKVLKSKGIEDFHWYIVGDGPDLASNKLLTKELGLSDVITFCGRRDNPFSLINQADLFVLTSSWESYGMVIKEAFVLGKPVIAMRYYALPEIIDNGFNGLIAEQNVQSLADTIMSVLQDDCKLLKELKKNTISSKVNNDEALSQFESLI